MAGVTFTQGSGVADSIYGKSQAPIRMFIEKRAEAFEKMSVLDKIFNMMTSENWAEKLTAMTAMNGFQPVGENGNYPKDEMKESFDKIIVPEVWKDSFSISKEAIDDARTMDLKKKPDAFTTSYFRTREMFAAAMLGGAISGLEKMLFRGFSFDLTGADKVTYFNKAHKSVWEDNKKTQSNLFKDAFSVDALSAAESAMQDFRGDNDEVLAVAPDTIVISNDYKLKKAVFEAIGSDKDPATANNGFNYQFGRWNVIVWQYLNQFITKGTSPWVLIDSEYNKTHDGAVFLDRVKLAVNSYIDNGNDANVWNGYARFTAGFNDWRAMSVGGITSGTQLIS